MSDSITNADFAIYFGMTCFTLLLLSNCSRGCFCVSGGTLHMHAFWKSRWDAAGGCGRGKWWRHIAASATTTKISTRQNWWRRSHLLSCLLTSRCGCVLIRVLTIPGNYGHFMEFSWSSRKFLARLMERQPSYGETDYCSLTWKWPQICGELYLELIITYSIKSSYTRLLYWLSVGLILCGITRFTRWHINLHFLQLSSPAA